jgi:hypothetical protein
MEGRCPVLVIRRIQAYFFATHDGCRSGFFSKAWQCWPLDSYTAVEGRERALNPKTLQPFGKFLSQVI